MDVLTSLGWNRRTGRTTSIVQPADRARSRCTAGTLGSCRSAGRTPCPRNAQISLLKYRMKQLCHIRRKSGHPPFPHWELARGRRKVNKLGEITLKEPARGCTRSLRLMRAAFADYEGVLDLPSGAHNETILRRAAQADFACPWWRAHDREPPPRSEKLPESPKLSASRFQIGAAICAPSVIQRPPRTLTARVRRRPGRGRRHRAAPAAAQPNAVRLPKGFATSIYASIFPVPPV